MSEYLSDTPGFGRGILLAAALLEVASKIEPLTAKPLDIRRGGAFLWLRDCLSVAPCADSSLQWIEDSKKCESTANFPLRVMPHGSSFAGEDLPDREVLVQVILQEPVSQYRIDIAVHVSATVEGKTHRWHVAVECDGRDFHSSDERLQRDATKDAALREHGFKVYRFDGRDVWNGARDCCGRVVDPLHRACVALARKGVK